MHLSRRLQRQISSKRRVRLPLIETRRRRRQRPRVAMKAYRCHSAIRQLRRRISVLKPKTARGRCGLSSRFAKRSLRIVEVEQMVLWLRRGKMKAQSVSESTQLRCNTYNRPDGALHLFSSASRNASMNASASNPSPSNPLDTPETLDSVDQSPQTDSDPRVISTSVLMARRLPSGRIYDNLLIPINMVVELHNV